MYERMYLKEARKYAETASLMLNEDKDWLLKKIEQMEVKKSEHLFTASLTVCVAIAEGLVFRRTRIGDNPGHEDSHRDVCLGHQRLETAHARGPACGELSFHPAAW